MEARRAALSAASRPPSATRESISLDGFDAVAHERQWTGGAALALFASLAPTRTLLAPVTLDVTSSDQRLPSTLHASSEGAFVLAKPVLGEDRSAGPSVRWDIAPSPQIRASFVLPVGGSGATVTLELDAEAPADRDALRAHCLAYFRALGLTPAAR